MSGKYKIMLDTNAISYILSGKLNIDHMSANADEILISFVSEIEYKVNDKLSKSDLNKFDELKSRVSVVHIEKNDSELLDNIIKVRKKYKPKIPDSIIAATCLVNKAILVTADKDFEKIHSLNLSLFKN